MIGHMPLHIVIILWFVERRTRSKSIYSIQSIDYKRTYAWIDKFMLIVRSSDPEYKFVWVTCVDTLIEWVAKYQRDTEIMERLSITQVGEIKCKQG
jgi:hypothetical protein